MTRWKISLEYDGGGFCGWQRQENVPSVQQALEEAVKAFSGEVVRVQGSGRTDTGVHALAQVAHFDLEKPMDADAIRGAMNFYLKEHPVVVLAAEEAAPDFHARFSAKQRRYLYRVINRRAPLVLERNRALHAPKPLALEPMREGVVRLIGQHDFSTFRAQDCQAQSPIKTLDDARIEQAGDDICFHFAARSFLYHQVRNMVGTLLLLGTGQWDLAQFDAAFAARDRKQGGPTAPPQGLYFVGVDYE